MGIKITIPNTSSDTLTFGSANTTTAAQIAGIDSGSTNGQLAIYTTASGTSTERVRVDSAGNVGIGTASPGTKLDVSGVIRSAGTTGASSPEVSLLSSGYWTWRVRGDGNDLRFMYDATTGMILNSSGNVGIGTSSPASKLHVKGASNYDGVITADNSSTTGGGAFQIRQNGTVCGYYTTNGVAQGNTGSDIAIYAETGKAVTFFSGGSPTERMRIDSSGNLLVGTTSTIDTIENLQVVNNSAQQMLVRNSSASAGSYWKFGADSSNNYTVYSSSGTGGVYLTTTATSWSVRSDERVKDIIEPISDAVNKVSQLRAVIGKYKADEDGIRRSFLIAQDVQAVLPEAVNVQEDEIGTLGVQYTDVIPLLVAAIKEQQALIQQLTDRITALEAK